MRVFILGFLLASIGSAQAQTCPYTLGSRASFNLPIENLIELKSNPRFFTLTNALTTHFYHEYSRSRKLQRFGSPFEMTPASQLETLLGEWVNDLPRGLNLAQLKKAYEAKIESRLQKRVGQGASEIVYNSDFENPFDLLFDGKMQCYSGTVLNLLLARLYYGEVEWKQHSPLVIFRDSHVLSGFIQKNRDGSENLIGVEQTGAADSTIDFGLVAQVRGRIRILDADDFLQSEVLKLGLSPLTSGITYQCLLQKTATRLGIKFFKENEAEIGIGSVGFSSVQTNSKKLNESGFAFAQSNSKPPPRGDLKREFFQTRESGAIGQSTVNSAGPYSGEANQARELIARNQFEQESSRIDLQSSDQWSSDSAILQTSVGVRYRRFHQYGFEILDDPYAAIREEQQNIIALFKDQRDQEAVDRFSKLILDFSVGIDLSSLNHHEQKEFIERACHLDFELPYMLENFVSPGEQIRVSMPAFQINGQFDLSDFENSDRDGEPMNRPRLQQMFAEALKRKYHFESAQLSQSYRSVQDEDAIRRYQEITRGVSAQGEAERINTENLFLNQLGIQVRLGAFDSAKDKITQQHLLTRFLDRIFSDNLLMTSTLGAIHSAEVAGIGSVGAKILLLSKESLSSLNPNFKDDFNGQSLKAGTPFTNSLGETVLNIDQLPSSFPPDLLTTHSQTPIESFQHTKRMWKSKVRRELGGLNLVIASDPQDEVVSVYTPRLDLSFLKLVSAHPDLARALKQAARVGVWMIELAKNDQLSSTEVDPRGQTILIPVNTTRSLEFDQAVVNRLINLLSVQAKAKK